jgi:hypothetical protein
MTTAGLEPATFWCRWAIEAKRATIALGSLGHLCNAVENLYPHAWRTTPSYTCTRAVVL